MTDVKGFCEPRFEAVRAALAALLSNDDVGASAAVYVDGEPVVDIWGGYADADRSVGWERDTLTGVNSTTKNMTAMCALILADRGELDLSAPVAAYWPEFATAGKENVLVRHVLSHTAGLPDLSGPTTVQELYDWASVTAGLAAQAPEWEPGTAMRLSRAHLRLPRGGDRPPHHRPQSRRVLRRRGGQTARRGLPHRPLHRT